MRGDSWLALRVKNNLVGGSTTGERHSWRISQGQRCRGDEIGPKAVVFQKAGSKSIAEKLHCFSNIQVYSTYLSWPISKSLLKPRVSLDWY